MGGFWGAMMRGVFVDFIRISQRHAGRLDPDTGELLPILPLVDSGIVAKFSPDAAGELQVEWEVTSRRQLEGSFDSLILLHSDGFKVSLEGNVGRFNRPDNVFNLDFEKTIAACNRFLAQHDLPPFTTGERIINPNPSEYDVEHGLFEVWTGATISEIHLTRNYLCGSYAAAESVISWLNTQSVSHIKKGRGGPTTVAFGSNGTGRKKMTFYLKAPEMLSHPHGRKRAEIKADPVYQYCQQNGLLRAELKAKRLLLRDAGLRYLGDITMPKLVRLYEMEMDILDRVKVDASSIDLSALPSAVRSTADSYLRGGKPRTYLSQATFYRHAKILRGYGLDITADLDRENSPQFRIEVVQIQIVEQAPEWYWPHQRQLRLIQGGQQAIAEAA